MITIARMHDFCAGHRLVGHEGKCKHLHGHGYRVHFVCTAEKLDSLGRIVDFAVIKDKLCQWIEDNWDHRLLLWEDDPIAELMLWQSTISEMFNTPFSLKAKGVIDEMANSIHRVPFNPSAENIANYLLRVVGPKQLEGTGVTLLRVQLDETPKCSAVAELDENWHTYFGDATHAWR